MTWLDNEFQRVIDAAREIATTKESITYPSMQSAHRVRHVMKQLLYIMDARVAQDAVPYMPTMDEVHRFMVSNPSTSTEMILDINKKRASVPAQQ